VANFQLPILFVVVLTFASSAFAQLNEAQSVEKKCLEDSQCPHEDFNCESQRRTICREQVRTFCNLFAHDGGHGGQMPSGCASGDGSNSTSNGQQAFFVQPGTGRANSDENIRGGSSGQQSRVGPRQTAPGATSTTLNRSGVPTSDSSSEAQQQAQQDRLACESVSQQVSQVCADRAIQIPQITSQSNEGFTQFCARAQQTMFPIQQQLNSDSENCRATIQGCLSNCGQLVQKYQGLLNACSGCESQSVYQSSLSMAQNAQSSCQQQSGRPQAIAQRAGEMGRFAGAGNSCGNSTTASAAMTAQSYDPMTGMLTQTAQGALTQYLGDKLAPKAPSLPNAHYDCLTNPGSAACQDCASYPNSPSCLALANAGRENQGTASFASSTKEHSLDEFNVGQGMANSADPLNFGPSSMPSHSAGMIQRPANNSGGGIPGGDSGGSGAGSAKLDPARKSSPGSPGYPTDIDQGLRGGGGFATNPAGSGTMAGATLASAGGQQAAAAQNGGSQAGRGPASMKGLDLKSYLPGGANDPRRGRMMSPTQSEIHGPGVDIWNRISIRMQEKCRLGLLYDCR